jgi:hypothetical protein
LNLLVALDWIAAFPLGGSGMFLHLCKAKNGSLKQSVLFKGALFRFCCEFMDGQKVALTANLSL